MLSLLTRNKIQNSLREKTTFYSSLTSPVVPNTAPGPEKMLKEGRLDE